VRQASAGYNRQKELGPDFRLNRAQLESVINPFDEYALEEALRVKEAHGGEVTVLTMGPATAEDTMRKALAMGADKGCWSPIRPWRARTGTAPVRCWRKQCGRFHSI
jgi:electron transfer flavoprotein beta subunit